MSLVTVSFNDLLPAIAAITPALHEAINRVFDSGRYLTGKETELFEQEWAAYCGQKYCVTCASGTDALTLAAIAMNLQEAEVQGNTIPLTAVGLHKAGVKVKIVEIDSNGHLLNVTDKSVPVLLYGRNPSENELKCRLFDAAQAHGWKPPSHAVACWSFYPTKTLGAMGDAGAITTNDLTIATTIKSLVGRNDILRDSRQITSRMDEIQAAILRVKLKQLDYWLEIKRKIANIYYSKLADLAINQPGKNHLFVIRTKDRDLLKAYLFVKGIETKVHFPVPLNKQIAPWGEQQELPMTELWCNTVLSLPCYPGLTDDTINYICDTIMEKM